MARSSASLLACEKKGAKRQGVFALGLVPFATTPLLPPQLRVLGALVHMASRRRGRAVPLVCMRTLDSALTTGGKVAPILGAGPRRLAQNGCGDPARNFQVGEKTRGSATGARVAQWLELVFESCRVAFRGSSSSSSSLLVRSTRWGTLRSSTWPISCQPCQIWANFDHTRVQCGQHLRNFDALPNLNEVKTNFANLGPNYTETGRLW